jgi:hypothetical protein
MCKINSIIDLYHNNTLNACLVYCAIYCRYGTTEGDAKMTGNVPQLQKKGKIFQLCSPRNPLTFGCLQTMFQRDRV